MLVNIYSRMCRPVITLVSVGKLWRVFVMTSLILHFGLFLPQAQADQSLPQLGENSAVNIEREKKIGQGLYQELLDRNLIETNPLLNNYINEIGARLLSGLDHRVREYQFFLVKDASVNAFAAPGGYIGIHAGLVYQAQTLHQLASVMAHEIAHVRLMHGMRMAEKAGDVGSASLIYLLVGILLASSNPDLGAAVFYGGAAGGQQAMVNFTRDNEYEADRLGIGLLQNAGFDAQGMVEFFRILGRKSGQSETQSVEYLRTHPVSENRIAEASQRVKPTKVNALVNDDFSMFKDYLASENSVNLEQGGSDFRLALARAKNGDHVKADEILMRLYQGDNENIWYSYAFAENLEYLGRLKEAEQVYRRFLDIFPGNFVFSLKLVRLLTTRGEYESALEIARRLKRDYPKDINIYSELIEIYNRLEQPVLRMVAEAEYHGLRGNLTRASQIYESILKRSDLDLTTESRVREKLKQINKKDS